MEIQTEGIYDAQRSAAEDLLRAIFLRSLREPTQVTFHHTDSLGLEVRVSVPKLNGELKVPVTDLLRQMAESLASFADGKIVESKMRGTCNACRQTPSY